MVIVGFASATKHLEIEHVLEEARTEWSTLYKVIFLFAHYNTEDSIKLKKKIGLKGI